MKKVVLAAVMLIALMKTQVQAQTQGQVQAQAQTQGQEMAIWPEGVGSGSERTPGAAGSERASGAAGSERASGAADKEKVRIAETGDHVISNIHRPTVTYYPADPKKATGAAVIIAPGGGHVELWIDHEGYRPAQWLSEHGVAAFVLKYRLAKEPGSQYTVDVESLADIQRAIRYVRAHATAWGIDSLRVGVMGFSAGGELAALAAMRYDSVQLPVHDAVDRFSSRPDFQALIYPGNAGRFTVTRSSPPVFILCGYKDGAAISEGMARLYLRYKELDVPAELHILANVGHGFGIRATNTGAVAAWPQRLYDWMGDSGFLKAGR
jgi:endo-1,4-beta-xylanase